MAVIGGGTLGRRIALMFAAGGLPVHLYSRSAESRAAAREYVEKQIHDVASTLGVRRIGQLATTGDLSEAVTDAWLVIESLSEDIDLKRRVFTQLNGLASNDAILATNSSSHPSSALVDSVNHSERLLNLHFQMPPVLNAVELMSCGRTDPDIIPALSSVLKRVGLVPFHVQQESVGFLFNRVWAAITRECLMVLEEGVSTPEQLDAIFRETLGTRLSPCRQMDDTGLDVVLAIEEHYARCAMASPRDQRACCAT